MTNEEMRFQVALSCIQGVLEAKHGIIGEIVPSVAVKESLRIADEFVKQWLGEHPKEQKPVSVEEVLAKAGLKPYKDGNQWCILAGDNIQEGICGFGNTIDEALYQFLMEVLEMQKEHKPVNNSTREKIISRATSEKQVVLISESSGKAEIGWDTRSLEDAKKLLEYGLAFIDKKGIKPAEKQKEPHYTKRNALFDKCVENCDPEVMKEVSDKVDEMLEKEQKPTKPAGKPSREDYLYQLLINQLITCSDYEYLMERKPADYCSVRDKFDLDGNLKQKPAESSNESVIQKAYKEGINDGIALVKKQPEDYGLQKSVPISCGHENGTGWSEEDEAHRNFILESLEDQIRFCKKDAEGAYCAKQIRIAQNWLKSLPERFNLSPKHEWSEEYERKIVELKTFIAECNGFNKSNRQKAFEMIDALSPQPKQEWSEEDDVMLDKVCCLISPGTKLTDDNANYCVELKQWIISLRERMLKSIRPFWKPSEEQMEYLYNASERNDYCGAVLNSLYHDLKKLM